MALVLCDCSLCQFFSLASAISQTTKALGVKPSNWVFFMRRASRYPLTCRQK